VSVLCILKICQKGGGDSCSIFKIDENRLGYKLGEAKGTSQQIKTVARLCPISSVSSSSVQACSTPQAQALSDLVCAPSSL
jgi:hypothetical protein